MDNKNATNMPDSEMPVDDTTTLPTPPVEMPNVPVLPSDSPATRSDYPDKRGSAAAADPPTPAVATQAKQEEAILRSRGTAAGGKAKVRSRSPTPRGAAGSNEVADHVQLPHAQVGELNWRFSTL